MTTETRPHGYESAVAATPNVQTNATDPRFTEREHEDGE